MNLISLHISLIVTIHFVIKFHLSLLLLLLLPHFYFLHLYFVNCNCSFSSLCRFGSHSRCSVSCPKSYSYKESCFISFHHSFSLIAFFIFKAIIITIKCYTLYYSHHFLIKFLHKFNRNWVENLFPIFIISLFVSSVFLSYMMVFFFHSSYVIPVALGNMEFKCMLTFVRKILLGKKQKRQRRRPLPYQHTYADYMHGAIHFRRRSNSVALPCLVTWRKLKASSWSNVLKLPHPAMISRVCYFISLTSCYSCFRSNHFWCVLNWKLVNLI